MAVLPDRPDPTRPVPRRAVQSPRTLGSALARFSAAVAVGMLGAGVPTQAAAEDAERLTTVAFGAAYTGETWHVLEGGVARGSAYVDNLDLQLEIDGERLFGVPNLTLFAYGLYNNGREFAGPYAGAAQGVSNIEAVRAWRLYEAWADWGIGPGTLRVGLYNLNSEFDVNETGGLFLHPAHGIGTDFAQSGVQGPSVFPVTSLAARYRVEAGEWTWAVAALDGVPGDPDDPTRTTIRVGDGDGALVVAEAAHAFGESGRALIGAWHYSAKFDDVLAVDADGEPVPRRAGTGAYALVEGALGSPAWRGFVRLGWADPRVHAFEHYLGAGVVRTAPWRARPDDSLGIAIATARNGSRFRTAQALAGAPVEGAEATIEFAYRWVLGEHLYLQPDVQYVRNPSTDPALEDAWVAGLRFNVAWGWQR
ncbi:MAG: carbohydrate porin [Pseudomonadota bacterium]